MGKRSKKNKAVKGDAAGSTSNGVAEPANNKKVMANQTKREVMTIVNMLLDSKYDSQLLKSVITC